MKVLIVDDEKPARDRLSQLLEDIDGVELAGVAENGEQAVAACGTADVVLLDIRMPGLSGIEAAHHINQLENPPAVIFTTAYDEYAIEAFEARAIGYVLKPVRRQRLANALEQAARLSGSQVSALQSDEKLASTRRNICVRRQDELQLVPIENVRCFIADQKYVRVQHEDGEDLIAESLKSLETEFGDAFVRVHRSAIVAVDHIDRIGRNDDGQNVVVLRGGYDDNELVISRRHLSDVRRRIRG